MLSHGMIYRFGTFSLDVETCELRSGDRLVPVEPQVFALLRLLIENRDQLVSREQIIATVWRGRIVSDSAISSRIKSARQALGDSGKVQAIIRTAPKLGFRFVAPVEVCHAAAAAEGATAEPQAPADDLLPGRPSIAVLPFTALPSAGPRAWIADALPQDLITALSRLRWLFVIARGSSFQFRGAQATPERVRTALKVRYCLTGAVEFDGPAMTVSVELWDAHDGAVVWAERFRAQADAVHAVREQLTQAVLAALELQIPLNEAQRARLASPDNLDAWSAYHLALRQMYLFSREGTARAAILFERATVLEPSFARAYAGLSFAHFEKAFLSFAENAQEAADLARRYAETSLEHDPLDPFCNLVMGRAFWLTGDLEASLPWLERANQLNPNYAQARYSRGWSETLLGRATDGRASVSAALDLSPLDPLAYGMLGVRAFSHMAMDETELAADWGEQAARAPGAHPLIELIAAVGHTLNGDRQRAEAWALSARRRNPNLRAADFLRAFPFREPHHRERIGAALSQLDL
jgi:TolB-like protein/Flp pilus assembly protein TadD